MISEVLISVWLAFASASAGLSVPVDGSRPSIVVGALSSPEWGAQTEIATGKITLAAFDESPQRICELTHELVHWLQFKHGVLVVGGGNRNEPPAFRAQAECLTKMNQPEWLVQWYLQRGKEIESGVIDCWREPGKC